VHAALNLAYVIAALIGFLKRPPLRGAILALILLRCTLLATLEAPEPRYTLEIFPPLIALAAVAIFRSGIPQADREAQKRFLSAERSPLHIPFIQPQLRHLDPPCADCHRLRNVEPPL
jgi:hypothetical protein